MRGSRMIPPDAHVVSPRRAAVLRAVGVDVVGALNLVGSLIKYLSPAFLFPAGDRARLRRAGVAVPRRRARSPPRFGHRARGGHGRAASASARARAISSSRCCGSSSPSSARCPTCSPSRSWRARSTRCSSPCRASRRRARACSATSRALSPLHGHVAPVHRSGSAAWGSSCSSSPCCRACASAAARRCSRRRCPGPSCRWPPRSARPRGASSSLYVALTALEIAGPRGARLDGHRPAHDAVRRGRALLRAPSPPAASRPRPRSIEPFAPATQWAIVVFMLVAGTNFAAALRERRDAARRGCSPATRSSASAPSSSSSASRDRRGRAHHAPTCCAGEEAVRHGVFNTVSMMTTTGFASADFNQWTSLTDAGALRRRC